MVLGPGTYNEYQKIKQQLEVEKHPGKFPGDPPRSFHTLSAAEQAQMEKKRLAGTHLYSMNDKVTFGSRYSRTDQVKFVDDSL